MNKQPSKQQKHEYISEYEDCCKNTGYTGIVIFGLICLFSTYVVYYGLRVYFGFIRYHEDAFAPSTTTFISDIIFATVLATLVSPMPIYFKLKHEFKNIGIISTILIIIHIILSIITSIIYIILHIIHDVFIFTGMYKNIASLMLFHILGPLVFGLILSAIVCIILLTVWVTMNTVLYVYYKLSLSHDSLTINTSVVNKLPVINKLTV
jgi:hypothetical protein